MDTEALRQQVVSLERRFHRLQCAAGMILLVLAASILMAQTASNRVVTATEFVLKDGAGVTRATLDVEKGSAGLSIYDQTSRVRARVRELPDGNGAQITLFGGDSHITSLGTSPGDSYLVFSKDTVSEIDLGGSLVGYMPDGKVVTHEPHFAMRSNKKSVSIDMSSPVIEVIDAEGFAAHIGSSDLLTSRTGATSKTSAAAVTLFGKDGKVLWSAP
jgi:hypothetical protein